MTIDIKEEREMVIHNKRREVRYGEKERERKRERWERK